MSRAYTVHGPDRARADPDPSGYELQKKMYRLGPKRPEKRVVLAQLLVFAGAMSKLHVEKKKEHEEKDMYLGPKRHVWRRLGPFSTSPPDLTLPVHLKHQ